MGCGKSTEKVTKTEITQTVFEPLKLQEKPAGKGANQGSPRPSFAPVGRLSGLSALYPPHSRSVRLRLDHAYGYQSSSSPQNLYYLSTSDLVVFPCASLAVVLTVSNMTQRFLGGGEVHSAVGHLGTVTTLAVNKEREIIATGEEGEAVVVCVWKLPALTPALAIELKRESVGVVALAFSWDSKRLAVLDKSAAQQLRVFDPQSGNLLQQALISPGTARVLSFSPKHYELCSVGPGHTAFWLPSEASFTRVAADFPEEMTAVRWFSFSECVTAGKSGQVHHWVDRRVHSSYQVLPQNCEILTVSIYEDCVLVGGRDNKVHVLDSKFKEVRVIETPGAPISVDMSPAGVLCGTEIGSIVEFGKNGRVMLMDAHPHADTPCFCNDNRLPALLLTASGNSVKQWDTQQRKCMLTGVLEAAKTFSPASSICTSAKGHVAVGHCDGHFTVRASSHQLNNILAMRRDNRAKVTVMKYQPSGELLLVGTEAGAVRVYNARENYTFAKELKGHSSEVIAADWSGSIIRTQDSSLKVCCWNVESGEKAQESAVPAEGWATHTLITATTPFPTRCSMRTPHSAVVARGTSRGVLELCSADNSVTAFTAHSDAVVGLHVTDTSVFSLSLDHSLLQWTLA